MYIMCLAYASLTRFSDLSLNNKRIKKISHDDVKDKIKDKHSTNFAYALLIHTLDVNNIVTCNFAHLTEK